MSLLRSIKTAVMPLLPRPRKEAAIDRTARQMPALSFGFPFGAAGYQTPSTEDPWISLPGRS